jgi:hypothetical protein
MRRAASICQLAQVMAGPRGARTVLALLSMYLLCDKSDTAYSSSTYAKYSCLYNFCQLGKTGVIYGS